MIVEDSKFDISNPHSALLNWLVCNMLASGMAPLCFCFCQRFSSPLQDVVVHKQLCLWNYGIDLLTK